VLLPLTLACQLFAGGFWLQLGNPEASAEARQNNAVVIIKTVGCHHPETAQVSANAIGMVDGKRQTIALKVIPLSEPGTFVLSQQWPRNGRWVIQVVGKNGEQFTNTLISAGPQGLDRLHALSNIRPFQDRDVDALLSN
jgi:hypothetical protein